MVRSDGDRPHGGRVRIAVVGLGYWGPNLARNFDQLAELAWICDMDAERLTAFTGRYSQARGTGSFEELLEDDALDAVVIATPGRPVTRAYPSAANPAACS